MDKSEIDPIVRQEKNVIFSISIVFDVNIFCPLDICSNKRSFDRSNIFLNFVD